MCRESPRGLVHHTINTAFVNFLASLSPSVIFDGSSRAFLHLDIEHQCVPNLSAAGSKSKKLQVTSEKMKQKSIIGQAAMKAFSFAVESSL
jgi:hypothetical protein